MIDLTKYNRKQYVECPVVEYCGIQRKGKSTLMVADIVLVFMNKRVRPLYYLPDEVYCNYPLHIDGVHCGTNEQMISWLQKAREDKWEHKLFSLDEASQPPLFYARNTKDKLQTELVTSLWQTPKLKCTFLYSDNIGNSVDVQQRDATWYSVLLLEYNDHCNPDFISIDYRVVSNYGLWFDDYTLEHVAIIQELFDSFAPIK